MSLRFRWLVPVLLVAWTAAARAEPTVHDLIPANATAGIAIRNLDDLQKKGDKLVQQAELKIPARPSELFGQLCSLLNITRGLDRKGAGAAVLANPKDCGIDKPLQNFEALLSTLVIIVPFEDRDVMAGNFGIKKGDLKPDTTASATVVGQNGFLYAHGKHLYLGLSEKAILSVVRGKSSAEGLSAAQRRSLSEADILLHLGVENWGEDWQRTCKDIEHGLPDATQGIDPEAVRQFGQALSAVRAVQAGLYVQDEGVRLQVVTVFDPKKSEAARKLLGALRAGSGGANLTGLPEGRVVTAFAFGAEGSRNAAYARLWLHLLLQSSPWSESVIARADRTEYLGVVSEVWKRLKGGRAALYHNPQETKQGLFSGVAVLDVEDPAAFVSELKLLMRLGDGRDLKLGPSGSKDDVAAVQKLVRDLGNDEFAVREAASTKLQLLGEAALPYLEAALKADDAEVRRRASELKNEIVLAAEERRKELLAKDVPHPIHPSFTYFPKAQQLDGLDVDVVKITLTERDAATAAKLGQLFGPNWDKVRLVVLGKQVVVLLGSDEKPLRETLANLKAGRPGLAGSKVLTSFQRQADTNRTAELHLSLRYLQAMMKAEDLEKPAKVASGSLTSVALSADEERLQLDLVMPVPELAVLLNAWGL